MGRGDQRPLPEATGQLMRILQRPEAGLRHTHLGEQFKDTRVPGCLPEAGVQFQCFAHLVADPAQRIQGGEGVLEDEADVPAAHRLPLTLAPGAGVLPTEGDGVGADLGLRPGQPHQGAGRH